MKNVASRAQSPLPPSPRAGVDWSIALPLAMAHVLALAALGMVTWAGLITMVVLYLATGLGVTAGAHRLFTHASYHAAPVLRKVLAVLFLLSAQGGLLRWVRDHHIHHAFTDREGDPHSPHDGQGFWHAHLLWLWKRPPSATENKQLYTQYGASLIREPLLASLSKPGWMLAIHLLVMAAVYIEGASIEAGFSPAGWIAGWQTGLSCLLWGVFMRIVLVLHATSLVNSATHLWGYRNYETTDGSRNSWWVAMVSLGEGWHNNHHRRPAAANQGFHKWWEFDLTFCFLYVAGLIGLATDLRVYRASTNKTELWFPRAAKPASPNAIPA